MPAKTRFDSPEESRIADSYCMRVYEVRPRKDKRGVDLISDALPFGRLWYGKSNNVVTVAVRPSVHVAAIPGYETKE